MSCWWPQQRQVTEYHFLISNGTCLLSSGRNVTTGDLKWVSACGYCFFFLLVATTTSSSSRRKMKRITVYHYYYYYYLFTDRSSQCSSGVSGKKNAVLATKNMLLAGSFYRIHARLGRIKLLYSTCALGCNKNRIRLVFSHQNR